MIRAHPSHNSSGVSYLRSQGRSPSRQWESTRFLLMDSRLDDILEGLVLLPTRAVIDSPSLPTGITET